VSNTNTPTRRRTPRSKISSNEIVYLNFQSGNGAIVLDVSSDGLGIQAADRLEPNESLSFRLSARASPDIDLSGRIAWLDATRKRGGLLLNIPVEARPKFREWQRRYLNEMPKVQDLPSPKSAATSAPAAPTLPAQPQTETNGVGRTLADRPNATLFGSRGSIFVSEWEAPPEESHTLRNVGIFCLLLALVVVGSFYIGGRRQVGDLLIRLGEAIGGQSANTSAQVTTSQTENAPAQDSSAVAANGGTVPAPISPEAAVQSPRARAAPLSAPELSEKPPAAAPSPSQPAQEAASPPSPKLSAATPQSAQPSNATSNLPNIAPGSDATAAAPAIRPSQVADVGSSTPSKASSSNPGQAQVVQARKYLQGSNPADAAVAANLLWSAIEAGNTQAELILGDLYLRGQGTVPRNCAQAQALLTAAQSANVPGATEKLRELQDYGCR
jgi:hypothetical protein